ncbi:MULTISPECIES: hypothetical protein [Rhizobium]|uniref:hypothetical protein n=1 Tax=Rhizobium TaxID=379 RepID=UPI001B33A99E|nr:MULTISPECIES: hypothetical protein [Rhizobium]MBX4911259.1 hypothetical protein [Rhizobium bangladeshense]MBX5260375.1 hypothetical protein [Rhizobium sp. NLR16b]MBX5266465.1 hypothetical protein [Rhizobium sp. NLR16a]MBX5315033.1 hypothetical protein [Rhizobium sp. NLR11b]QTU98112.1 hypothetical protein J7U39_08090 [Rhizobium sp. NLR16a]
MARPKLGDSESKRLQMVITEDELHAIEQWQHENGVPSKSEAIRRLVQIGLRTTRALPKITADVAEVLDMTSAAIEIPEEVFATLSVEAEADQYKVDREIASRLFDAVNFAFNRQIEAQDNWFHLLVEIAQFTNNEEFADAVRLADEEATSEVPNEAVLQAIGASREVQIKYWRKRRDEIRAQREERK